MRAAVIEDQTLIRDYLVALLQKRCDAEEVVAIASMAELRLKERELEDVRLIVFDVDLGDGTTLDWAVKHAARVKPCAMVAVSSISGGFPFDRLQTSGISLVHKNDGEADLVDIIKRTLDGAVVLSRRTMEVLGASKRDPHSPMKLLGPKEQQVLSLLGQRLDNDTIAEMIGSAASTVADHRKRIMRKLEVHSIEELIDYAIKHGLVFDSRAAAAKSRQKPKA